MKKNEKWDARFMNLAKEISTWSKDPSSQIGAIIVNSEKQILATGYNGFPRGIEDTHERLSNRDLKYPLIVHAEMNCLLSALYNGISVKDATIYVHGLPPCTDCTKAIIQAGISRVVINHLITDRDVWVEKWETQSKKMLEETNRIEVDLCINIQ
jgi:dCMP deaminase